MAELSQAEPFSLEKEAPFWQWLSQTIGINVSRSDMGRERVSNIAGLCLTANLTAWFVWQELEGSMQRQLHVQNQLVLEAGCRALVLPFFSMLKGVLTHRDVSDAWHRV